MTTNISDGISIGSAGFQPDTRPTVGNVTTPGFPTTGLNQYIVTPAALSTTGLSTAQTVSGTTFTLTAGNGVTTTSINGTTYYDLGVSRNITVNGTTSVTVTDITVTGLDHWQQPMTATLSGPNGNTSVATTKTFRYVSSVAAAGNTTSNISIGTGDVFGFRYRVDNFGDVILNWNNTLITASTGFTAAVTSTATATTGDVRGTYAVQTASDGSKKLAVWIAKTVDNSSTNNLVYGVAQA